MNSLNKFLKKSVENYTFEKYCEDNNIDENSITNLTHENFVLANWSIARHRPYYRYQSKIYESILKSYDSKKLYNKLKENFEKYIVSDYYAYKDKANIKTIIIKYKDDSFIYTEKFKQLLNLYNYFVTYNDINSNVLHIEPNIPDAETEFIYKKCKGIVYHITKKSNFKGIKKYGLKPRTAAYRIFPERIFVTSGIDNNDIKENIDYVLNILSEDPTYNEHNICLLKIDLNKYKNKIKLFKDNGMGNDSYWTSEYIPPYCIEEINFLK